MFFSAQMSVGADQGLGSRRTVESHRNFHGCLENLVYNSVNLVDLAKEEDQRVTVKVNQFKACLQFCTLPLWNHYLRTFR